ncbi:hypothetical protein QBC46DRAFT_393514 [Diplogelasinospora grovesii]|uniref:Beta-lactamase superfamily domain-containing protein n=1 Tax=Diplogelasinospora grovesii TaxID=303347 RepID=A0AAN6S213_9PEZI|nr:hypothetical protein QBC46DRAFT_393514 [Diplogelasinospora grovesii]
MMALTVKHLNDDASFLLSFEPVVPKSSPGPSPQPFRILLDPWITGASKILHSKISKTTHRHPACISSLIELPEPDLVIISQDKSDHCNEATLRQLPATGTRTVVLAEPSSARIIRSWKYFDRQRVRTLPRWEDPRVTGHPNVMRIEVPPLVPGGEAGEVTVTFIPQRRDMSGLHGAVGITYRPPAVAPLPPSSSPPPPSPETPALLTPPTTPRSHRSHANLKTIFSRSTPAVPHHDASAGGALMPPSPTSLSPGSLRSVRSASSLGTTQNSWNRPGSQPASDRTLSVIFSPHGISYSSLHSYATSHLGSEAALPLTALLHCFDSVTTPWWLGGNVLLGAPAGTETAGRLGAKAWISAHDGDKEVKGLTAVFLRTRKWRREDVLGELNAGQTQKDGSDPPTNTATEKPSKGTEVFALGSGEEVILTNDGVANGQEQEQDEAPGSPSIIVSRSTTHDRDHEPNEDTDPEKGALRAAPSLPQITIHDFPSFANLGEVMNRPDWG